MNQWTVNDLRAHVERLLPFFRPPIENYVRSRQAAIALARHFPRLERQAQAIPVPQVDRFRRLDPAVQKLADEALRGFADGVQAELLAAEERSARVAANAGLSRGDVRTRVLHYLGEVDRAIRGDQRSGRQVQEALDLDDNLPPYLVRQRCKVLTEFPCFRQRSAVFTPVSDSRRIATICSSLNPLFCIGAFVDKGHDRGNSPFPLDHFPGVRSMGLVLSCKVNRKGIGFLAYMVSANHKQFDLVVQLDFQ